MQESYREGIASRACPEPCEGSREAALEALDRGICRLGIEFRKRYSRMPMVSDRQKATRQCTKKTRVRGRSCGVEDPTHAEKPGALWARENRETLPLPERRRAAGRKGNSQGQALHARW